MFVRSVRIFVLTALVVLSNSFHAAQAQFTSTGAMPLPAEQAFELSLDRLDDTTVVATWAIAPGYYLYKERIDFQQDGRSIAAERFTGVETDKDDPTFGRTIVLHDRVSATLKLPTNPTSSLTVHYQGCQENGICYPPVTRVVDASNLASVNPEHSAASSAQNSDTQSAPSETGITISDSGGMIEAMLRDGGVFTVLLSFLVFGVLLAFTPCVFPMYPILAAAIARQGEAATPMRSFFLSSAYVLAMATAFGLLGFAAAWSGQNLQMALQSPLAIGLVAALFLVLALSMFGIFELQLPSGWVGAIGKIGYNGRGTFASAAILGFTSALIVGPCVTAPLAGALIYIAQTGDVVLGAASLFALGLGKGIPLIIFGTIGQRALPKAGPWMNSVRQAFGFVFVATAVWMGARLLPEEAGLALWAILAICLAVWLGAFDSLNSNASGRQRVAKAAGLAVGLYGVMLGAGAASGASDPLRPLAQLAMHSGQSRQEGHELAFQTVGSSTALRNALQTQPSKPSLVYVTADWCVTCSIIERSVLSRPDVIENLSALNLIKVNVSENSPEQRKVMESLQVAGPPTMIFLNASGHEAAATRLVGDVTKDALTRSTEALGRPL